MIFKIVNIYTFFIFKKNRHKIGIISNKKTIKLELKKNGKKLIKLELKKKNKKTIKIRT